MVNKTGFDESKNMVFVVRARNRPGTSPSVTTHPSRRPSKSDASSFTHCSSRHPLPMILASLSLVIWVLSTFPIRWKVFNQLWIAERRVLYDYDKIGDTPPCLDRGQTNFTGRIALGQGKGVTEKGLHNSDKIMISLTFLPKNIHVQILCSKNIIQIGKVRLVHAYLTL